MPERFGATVLRLLTQLSATLPDPRPRARCVRLALALLCADRPKTLSSAIAWDRRPGDWSADYRLFSRTAWTVPGLFQPVLAAAVRLAPPGPLWAALDDTLVRKTGKLIPGTSFARDPLSPPFQTNLVLGQRFQQLALLLAPAPDQPCRAIPVGFHHAPPLRAPPRATAAERAAVAKARQTHNLSTTGAAELTRLRTALDAAGAADRALLLTADGSYANRGFLTAVPERTTVVARLRKDAHLRAVLPATARRGTRKYGPDLPTPAALLADPAVPAHTLRFFSHGELRELTYKVVGPVCWPTATRDCPVTLILLKPLGYRLRRHGKLLYRQPAYLVVVGSPVAVEAAIRAYLARWQIEVSFRDEKALFGVGQAQVWHPQAVARAPAFLVAAYACVLLASLDVFHDQRTPAFPARPPWRRDRPGRPSARDLQHLLRATAAAAPRENPSTAQVAAA